MSKLWLGLLITFFIANCSTAKPKEDALAPPPGAAVFVDQDGNKHYTGLIIPKGFKPTVVKAPLMIKALPPARDQGNCGSCWAMSSTSTLEDALRVKGIIRDLSEQFVLSCTKKYVPDAAQWGCNGGLFAHDIHMTPRGGVNEADYPYTATDSACKTNLAYQEKIASWAYISEQELPSVDQIKSAIYQYGPISVAVAVDNAFSNYKSGVHKTCGSTSGLNHAVNLIGWDDSDGGYFILRNSWGSGWGEKGFMRIAYNCDEVGSWANYVVVDGATPPAPSPDPGPGPGPNPSPTPAPDCTPQPVADIGQPDVIDAEEGEVIVLGTAALAGHKYLWKAEPAFNKNAQPKTAKIRYQPIVDKTLTLTATTKCGSATDTVVVNLSTVSHAIKKHKILKNILH
jgi:hypothetical protein